MESSKPRLSILVATIGRREVSFLALMDRLVSQIERNSIEVVAYWNNGEATIGDIRQDLLEAATGDYVCFIDDDDMVPDYYCDEIFYALDKDYVGFELELFEKDTKLPRVFHSIKYGVWHQDERGYYRGVTHLNPIKRSLALQGTFGKQGAGEDESWSRSVTPHVRTENYIDKIMYYYHHDADNTTFGGADQPVSQYTRPDYSHPQFRWHPKSQLSGAM